MQETITLLDSSPSSTLPEPDFARLSEVITAGGNLLPVSGPISAFVFLNNLQALEDLPFEQGLLKGARLYGCQPYLAVDRYREKMLRGRIRLEDLSAVLQDDLGTRADELINFLGTRFELRLAMLQHPLRQGPTQELRWFVAETDALTKLRDEAPPGYRQRFIDETRHWVMRDLRNGTQPSSGEESNDSPQASPHGLKELIQRFGESSIEDWSESTWEAFSLQALWGACHNGVSGVKIPARPVQPPVRHRDLLLNVTSEDSDSLVHDLLIRYCASYADQGFAHWTIPNREQGFYKAFLALHKHSGGPPDRWQWGLAQEINRLENAGLTPQQSILESLELLGVHEDEWDEYIPATLLALRGWASMIYQMEVRGDRVPQPALPGTLAEFLAVRLILDRLALAFVARHALQFDGPLRGLRQTLRARINSLEETNVEQRAFLIFQLAQVREWTPPLLHRLTSREWTTLISEVESFSSLEQRRIFHLAFERRFRTQALDAISIYTKRKVEPPVTRPRFQAVFCIDTREESFRRHLEEYAPDTETFSAAGFYGVAMYYKGVADAHYAALCPIVVRPKHWVVEEAVYTLENANRSRAKTRRALATASHHVHVGSRSIAGGALLTASFGMLASIPLMARVLFPRLTAQIRKTAGSLVAPPPVTRLRLERTAAEPSSEEEGIGFSLEEMANIGERMLREMSFSTFSRLVIFFGHGSFCLNNPHKSAYDCGACSGSAGSPNARALASILNDVRVRQILESRGLQIPSDTWFLGGLHNTCSDTVSFLDLDLLPKSHFKDFEAARETLEEVCERNAHERCRRFESAPLNMTTAAAHIHVEERSEDLAQTRPEYGNATNAMCIVARRSRTRGLYLDRRPFLVSYDPFKDDLEHTVLARILGAVVPVCQGINLTYNYSYIDSPGWGSGTKLPHNITSLLGVMDGAASDLRLGLPWQGVDIHEPMRCLFVIEATPATMFKIMERNPVVGRILRNGWAQLSLLNPESSEILVFSNNQFERYQPETTELPSAPSSANWYRGWRDHLGFAIIQPAR